MNDQTKFAVNFSYPTADLVDAGRIHLDLYKSPDNPHIFEPARSRGPTYVHFGCHAGRGRMAEDGLRKIHDYLAASQTPHVSSHLAPTLSDFPGMALDTTDPRDTRRILDVIEDDLAQLIDEFGPGKIVVENTPWDLEYQIPRPAIEPENIRRVIEHSGGSLLLDIAHAFISAKHLGMEAKAYMRKLPTDRLAELHVSGTAQLENGEWMDHYAMRDEDWDLTAWAMERIRQGDWPRPRIVAFEYGGIGPGYEDRNDERLLREHIPRLAAMVK